MAQDIVEDWQNREFIETVEIAVRKCVDFLNNFHESAKYRLSVVDARLSTLERKLDFLEASLEHCDPSQRSAKPVPFKGSIFDPEIRQKLIAQNVQKQQHRHKRIFNKMVVAPQKNQKPGRTIVNNDIPTASSPRKNPAKQSHPQQAAQPQPQPVKQAAAKQPKPKPKEAAAAKPPQPPQPVVAAKPAQAAPPQQPPANPMAAQQAPPPNPMKGKGKAKAAQQAPPPIPGGPPKPPSPKQQAPQQPPAVPGAAVPPPVPNKKKAVKAAGPVPDGGPGAPPPIPGGPGAAPGGGNYGGGGGGEEEEGPGAGPGAAGPGAPPPPVPVVKAVPPAVPPANPGQAAAQPQHAWPNKQAGQIDINFVEEGTGPVPGGQSAVEIEYTGHLPDGRQFIKHREVIQLGKKQNIKGLEQAVTRIKVGSVIQLWIPSKLAYGARGAGNLIPPNADLTFQLRLHRIVKQ
mmetsp:Transcript_35644/g.57256  ORF Transcript_35644/g.57256 Transcript_35644/m.57256 type:complete len:458 (-) Transcript_35644:625-1998(-)